MPITSNTSSINNLIVSFGITEIMEEPMALLIPDYSPSMLNKFSISSDLALELRVKLEFMGDLWEILQLVIFRVRST
jgi:hypothetical protein